MNGTGKLKLMLMLLKWVESEQSTSDLNICQCYKPQNKMTRGLINTEIACYSFRLQQGWPNVAHCMVGGGAFDVLGNLRKCTYRCPEKFVTGY